MVYLWIASRWVIAVVFAVSAAAKLRNRAAYRAFEAGLAAMEVVPPRVRRPVAMTVVTAEALVPVLVVVPATALPGLVVTLGLLTGLTLAVLTVTTRGTRAACPCFGAKVAPFGRRHLVRNIALIMVAAAGLLSGVTVTDGAVTTGGVLLALGAAVVLAALVVVFDDIVELLVGPVRGAPR
ncbi:MauE/DoxX family redox-associated membrane protein [Micromonospora purpureochromogenes]|uniref:MauE/DoxX family redox-associated membrane protein n=1 Tax=Micromonospora purpureochromogenes TaxID=47872 RepID=UPI0033E8CC64